ncbi:unnamed protein product, partial [marine sediment metagenome]
FEAHKEIPEDVILEITESIKSIGIIEPLIVRPKNGEFEIVAGCIRYRCAKLAGLKTAPCIILILGDQAAEEVKLHENLKRLSLDHVDQGNTFVMLREKHSMTEEGISKIVGKSQGYVSQHIALVSQDNDLVSAVRYKRITFSQAREIMTVKDKRYRQYLQKTCEDGGLTTELMRVWIIEDFIFRNRSKVLQSFINFVARYTLGMRGECCFYSTRKLSKLLKYSRTSIIDAIKKSKSLGYISEGMMSVPGKTCLED